MTAYITREELLQKLGRKTEGQDTHEEKIQFSLTASQKIVEHVTGTRFDSYDITSEYIDQYSYTANGFKMSCDRKSIWCPAPIISVSSMTEDSTALTENTDFYLYKATGEIQSSGIFSSARRVIVLSGTFGYSSVPSDIKEATLQIAQILTGLATTTYMDDSGDIVPIIKSSVPAWIWKHLKSRRWANV